MNTKRITTIIDNGELGFEGVLVETICIILNTTLQGSMTKVKSLPLNYEVNQKQNYITDEKFSF